MTSLVDAPSASSESTANFLDTIVIRPFTPDDYPALVALEKLVWPESTDTVEEMRFHDNSRAEKIKWGRFVAELPGVGIIARGGYGQSNDTYHPQKFGVGVLVHPDFQNRGLGTRLYDMVTETIAPFDPITIRCGVREDKTASMRFVQKRGFVEKMRDWESSLILADFDFAPFETAEQRARDAGIVIKTLTELESDPDRDRKIYALDWAVTLDMPSSDTMTEPGFDDWRKRTFENPNFLPDAWFVACDGDEYVGLSFLSKSQGSDDLYQGTTGVLRSHRRKGIALALKIRGARYAKDANKTKITTWNATSNRPMLNINEAMGFVKKPAWIDFAKNLTREEVAFSIRPFDNSDRDYQAVVDLNNAYFPDHPETIENLRSNDARRDAKLKQARFVAETPSGEIVGMGGYEQHLWSYDPHKFFTFVTVAPERQKQGIGSALYDHVLNALAPLAPTKLSSHVREDLAQSVVFAQKRGFVEEMREWESVLDVPNFDFGPWEEARQKAAQNGITICSYADLASDADRDHKLWKMEDQTLMDVPSSDPITPLDFEQYQKEILTNPHFLPDGFFVAVDKATGEYVGGSTLWKRSADSDLNQGLTGVLRSHRRKGIALALKLQTIDFAKSYGAKSIRTENATTNQGMLAINVALGFARRPAWIAYGNVLAALPRKPLPRKPNKLEIRYPELMQIRPFTPDDYPALVKIDNENFPDHLETEEQMRWGDDHREPKHKWARYVAEMDGAVVASGGYGQEGGMFHPRKFFVMVSVLPNLQGQGVGRAIYDHTMNAIAPFDPLSVRSFARENMARPVRFLQDRGFVEDMRFWESELDLSTFDFTPFDGAEEKPAEHGITIKTLAELMESDPNWKRSAYELAQAISRDIPRPEPWTPTDFSVWEQRLDHPDRLTDANFIALDGDKWVGISSLHKCQTEGVIDTGVTGTLPEYRRKGIALALKLRAVRYSLDRGFRFIRTGNETGNRPMLSINEAMGYVKKPAWVTFVKVLKTEDPTTKEVN